MARDHTIGVRLDDDELAALDALAAADRRKRADLARIILLDGIAARQPSAPASTRSERAAQRGTDHPFVAGSNPLRCLTCGVPKGKHP